MSSVLHVSLSAASPLPPDAVLKLYDRRCLTNIRRRWNDRTPWNPHKEHAYRTLLASVQSKNAVLPNFAEDDILRVRERGLSDGELEAYLHFEANDMFESECKAYDELKPLQGKYVPKFYGVVEWEVTIPTSGGYAVTEVIHGVLLEHIQGQSLRRFVETWAARQPPLSQSLFQEVCNQAVAVIDCASRFNIINEDVRLDNFIVREPPWSA